MAFLERAAPRKNPSQLFNLDDDYSETTNVATLYLEKVEDLIRLWKNGRAVWG